MTRNRHWMWFVSSMLALLIGACATLNPPAEKDRKYKLTVLHTNDHHGRFWQDGKGRYGMAARMTLIESIRKEVKAEGGHVLLFSGGDINTGVPESDIQDAIPDIKGMNLLGYDAMAVGNHEFDKPRDVLAMQQSLAVFPFLSANIFDTSTGKHVFEPYITFQLDGLRVAVVGFTTTDTPIQSNPNNVKDLDFQSPVAVASKLIPDLEKKADIIIATTHMGHYQDGNHGINAPGDVTLARSVKGIDLIVGGHSQDSLFKPDLQNDTYIVQAKEWGKYVGRADFEYANGQLTLISYRLIPVNGPEEDEIIPENQAMLNLLSPYQEKGRQLVEGKVGVVDQRLMGERSEVRFQPTNLGTLLAKALMEKSGADLAVMNGGGIRSSINGGEITYREVLMVLPFGNTLTTVDMTGKEMFEYLTIVANKPVDSGAFAHFSGVEMLVKDKQLHNVKINGKAIDPEKTYKMAILSFSAGGGDKYPNLMDRPGFVDTGYLDAEVLKEFIERHSPLQVADFQPEGVIRQ